MLEPLIEKYCPDIQLVPIVYSKIRSEGYEIPQIDPAGAAVNNFVSLEERQTRAQRHKGTRGRRIAQEIEAERLHKLFLESGQPELQTQFDSAALTLRRQ
jgi:hypothetical protein